MWAQVNTENFTANYDSGYQKDDTIARSPLVLAWSHDGESGIANAPEKAGARCSRPNI